MVWPVDMRYTKQFNSDEVQLQVFDYGNTDAKGECTERLMMRRLYKNSDEALAALTAPDNQLSKAMWDNYSSEYEISCIGIMIGETRFGCIDDYEDEDGNLILQEYFDTGTTLQQFKDAFKFSDLDVLHVRTYDEHVFSKEAIATEASAQMPGRWLEDADDLFSEFSAYIGFSKEALAKPLSEIITTLKDCGALDKAFNVQK